MNAATPGQAEREREVLRSAFAGFLASQGYDDQGRFDQDEMELAFETGWQIAQAAPGDALAKEILENADPDDFEVDNGPTAVEYVRRLEAAYDELAKLAREPKPAPELAAELRRTQDSLAAAICEQDRMAALIAEILGNFGPSGSGHAARVGQVQIRKWRERAGLPS